MISWRCSLRPGYQEGLHHAPARGGNAASLTVTSGLVHHRLGSQEGLHHLQVPVIGGPVQRVLPPLSALSTRPGCQEGLHHLKRPLEEAMYSGV